MSIFDPIISTMEKRGMSSGEAEAIIARGKRGSHGRRFYVEIAPADVPRAGSAYFEAQAPDGVSNKQTALLAR